MTDVIDEFNGQYRFLSNFYPAPVTFEGAVFPTVENAYQAAKLANKTLRANVQLTRSPAEAKRFVRKCRIRPDWDRIKEQVMLELLHQKFARGGPLAQILLLTGDDELIEGNTRGDTYWGVCNGKGKNRLGKLLMKVRSELMAIQKNRVR